MIARLLRVFGVELFDSMLDYGALSASQMAAWSDAEAARKKLDRPAAAMENKKTDRLYKRKEVDFVYTSREAQRLQLVEHHVMRMYETLNEYPEETAQIVQNQLEAIFDALRTIDEVSKISV